MKYILAGKKDRAVACLKAMIDSGRVVSEIIVDPDDTSGYWSPALSDFAEGNRIPVYSPTNINSPESVKHLGFLKPDVVILSSYTQIIREPLLSLPTYGFINLHGGKLPEYRGASTLNWMIINGEDVGGVSIIKIDKGVDTGPILAQETFPITSQDDINTVTLKSLEIFPRLLLRVLDDLENGTLQEIVQNKTEGKAYRSRKPEDGRILWNEMDAQSVVNLVRALARPLPGAFSEYKGEKIVHWACRRAETNLSGLPGQVLGFTEEGMIVRIRDGNVLITESEKNGQRLNTADYFRLGDILS